MTIGPNLIIECPNCEGLSSLSTAGSGNTCDARLWTDGVCDAPMLPERAPLARCHSCRKIFWINGEVRQVGEVNPPSCFPVEPLLWFDPLIEKVLLPVNDPSKTDVVRDGAPSLLGAAQAANAQPPDEGGERGETKDGFVGVLAWFRMNLERKREFHRREVGQEDFRRVFEDIVGTFAGFLLSRAADPNASWHGLGLEQEGVNGRMERRIVDALRAAARRCDLASVLKGPSDVRERFSHSLLEALYQIYQKDRLRRDQMLAAPGAGTLSGQDFHEAIQAGLGNSPEKERLLRMLAWQCGNDPFRFWFDWPPDGKTDNGPVVRHQTEPQALENMRCLLRLLNEGSQPDLLMKAELLRELGEFEQADHLLARVTAEWCQDARKKIAELSSKKSRDVAEV